MRTPPGTHTDTSTQTQAPTRKLRHHTRALRRTHMQKRPYIGIHICTPTQAHEPTRGHTQSHAPMDRNMHPCVTTHNHTRPHEPSRTIVHPHTHIHSHPRAPTHAHTGTHTRTHAPTRTITYPQIHMPSNTHPRAHMRTDAHTRTHTHAHVPSYQCLNPIGNNALVQAKRLYTTHTACNTLWSGTCLVAGLFGGA